MRLMTVIVILAVATAVATGSATASSNPVRPDDRAGGRGPGSIAAGVKGPGGITGAPVATERPDDRAGVRGPGSTESVPVAAVRPDDRPGLRWPGVAAAPSTAPSVEIVRVSSDGFDWPAAFVGGASVLSLCLLVGAALLLRPRGRTTATS